MSDDDRISPTRRRLMQGASLGVATAMVGGSVWGTQPEDRTSSGYRQAAPLQDPRKGYPRPPFEPQSQPWPGLAGKMTPRPDHGETSYRGSGKLLDARRWSLAAIRALAVPQRLPLPAKARTWRFPICRPKNPMRRK